MMTQRKPGDYVVNAELTDAQIQRFVDDCVAAGAKDYGDCGTLYCTTWNPERTEFVEAFGFCVGGAPKSGCPRDCTREYKDYDMDKDQRIADLERRVAELEGQATQPEVTDEHVGRLVVVRNASDDPDEWEGPHVLEYVDDDSVPYVTYNGSCWEFAKLYTGPTRPNWIAHDGRGTPDEVREAKEALVQKRSGKVQMVDHISVWWNHEKIENYNDIVRYTIIEP